jgi:hypothetical protein
MGGILALLVGAALLFLGARQLRPRSVEMEEFLTGGAGDSRPAAFEAAGPILGIVGVISGIILFVGGVIYVMLQVL